MTPSPSAEEHAKEIIEEIYCPDYHWEKETERFLKFRKFLIGKIREAQQQAREEERGRCARIAEEYVHPCGHHIAAAIRSSK